MIVLILCLSLSVGVTASPSPLQDALSSPTLLRSLFSETQESLGLQYSGNKIAGLELYISNSKYKRSSHFVQLVLYYKITFSAGREAQARLGVFRQAVRVVAGHDADSTGWELTLNKFSLMVRHSRESRL